VEAILGSAFEAGLGRDGHIVGVGGGVVTDLAAFAASIYMRGIDCSLVSTSLLGMVDAALGGKTGFDLLGIKNLAGSFYPASRVLMPLGSLASLPPAEWKSGMGELIKTAILAEDDRMLALLESSGEGSGPWAEGPVPGELWELIGAAVALKGRIVEEDPQERGSRRILLNLGHSFGHALEAASGLGRISHGEAVAWGLARACELGRSLGITPPERARLILGLLESRGYETAFPHPLMKNPEGFRRALLGDKKKRAGKLRFIIPAERGCRPVELEPGDSALAVFLDPGSGTGSPGGFRESPASSHKLNKMSY
jgi:3-dehydroquinate synthase